MIGSLETVKVLLKYGAKIDGNPPESSRSVLHQAVMGNYVSHDEFLRNNMGAISFGNSEVIEELLVHNADLSSRDVIGNQPIHTCVQHNAIETLRYLLENHADKIDVNAAGSFGQTPLLEQFTATHGLVSR